MTKGRAGRVVVLNGTASAGKSTLARAIQRRSTTLWVVVSQDGFAQNLIPQWVRVDGGVDGGRGEEGFHFVRDDLGDLHVEPGGVGRRLLRSYRYAAAACARAGSDVIVDECKFDEEGWDEWQEALAGLEALWVRVECDLDRCEQREMTRNDRQSLVGLARRQYRRAHADARYDLTVDASGGDIDAAAMAVLAAADSQCSSLPIGAPVPGSIGWDLNGRLGEAVGVAGVRRVSWPRATGGRRNSRGDGIIARDRQIVLPRLDMGCAERAMAGRRATRRGRTDTVGGRPGRA